MIDSSIDLESVSRKGSFQYIFENAAIVVKPNSMQVATST